MNIKFKEIPLLDSRKLRDLMRTLSKETVFYGLSEEETKASSLDIFFGLIRERNLKDRKYIGVYDGNKLIGRCGIRREIPKRKRHSCILSIGIIKEYWGKGIGRKTLNRIIEIARDEGYEVMNLYCYSDNERAIRLYKSSGFEQCGKIKKCYKVNNTYYDCVMMQLDLKGVGL